MAEALTAADLQAAIDRLARDLSALAETHPIALLAIANGGIELTRILASRLGPDVPWGVVNALFHRDDVGLKPISADFQATGIDFPIDDAHLVLVDDVFATGRTVRAALNELFDHGRPATVHLAVLIDADRPILPIRPDFRGCRHPCPPGVLIKLTLDSHDPSRHTAELVPHA
jgi:pyrimidine operon attenuation protein / uracil phosphoribosyltransferase